MARSGRLGLTEPPMREFWQRWRAGESIVEICHALGKFRSSVSSVLRQHGGFAPPPRKRSPTAFTLAEREEISRGLSAKHSMRRIARTLQRAPSIISREIGRNGGRQGYRVAQADRGRASEHNTPKTVCWPSMASCGLSSLTSWHWTGPRNRYQAGCSVHILMMRSCACHTKRFIKAFSFRHVAY